MKLYRRILMPICWLLGHRTLAEENRHYLYCQRCFKNTGLEDLFNRS